MVEAKTGYIDIMLVLGTIVIGAREVPRAVGFWCAALDLVATSPYGENDFTNLCTSGGDARLSIQRSDHDPEAQPRLHLDLYARDRHDQGHEVERLISLGASRARWQYPEDADFVVLLDTEGNAFCVVDNSRAPAQFQLSMQDRHM